MLRSAEEIIKGTYGFYIPYTNGNITNDVSLNGKQVSELINEARKESAIEFFKWYGMKIVSLTTYLLEIKPLVRSEELEQKIAEFEGQSLDKLYELFLQSNEQK